MLFFSKIQSFLEKIMIIGNFMRNKLMLFLAVLTFLMAPLDAQQNFMQNKFFFNIWPRLNILSVIAIDWIEIFKYTKKHLAHFLNV